MKATHQNYKKVKGFQEINLEPGQFVFGRKKASEETGLSEQSVRTCLSFLKKSQNLTIKPTNKFSIVSIINWDSYQPKESQPNQQPNQQVTNNQPTTNHIQEHKNKEKEIYSRVVSYLNRKTGKNFKGTTKVIISLISARLGEGFTPDDFKTVIDNKTAQWLNDPENTKYLRPQTLFGTKFESYLNEKPVNGSKLSTKETLEKHGL